MCIVSNTLNSCHFQSNIQVGAELVETSTGLCCDMGDLAAVITMGLEGPGTLCLGLETNCQSLSVPSGSVYNRYFHLRESNVSLEVKYFAGL